MRTRLDLLRPDTERVVTDNQEEQVHSRARKVREFKAQDKVLMRNYSNHSPKWIVGVVTKRLGAVTYLVRTGNGKTRRCHVNQLLTATDSGQDEFLGGSHP